MTQVGYGAKREVFDFWDLFNPLKKQLRFLKLALVFRYMLYGGARGGGKSKLLRWGLLYMLLRWFLEDGHRDVRVGLFSEDYPTLKDRQISKIAREFPAWLGELKTSTKEGLGFFLYEEWGGGAILLRNLDDPEKYQSAEFAGIAVEELTKQEKSTFDILRGSLRWPGIDHTFFWGATNPGGIGHVWVKQLWIDRDFPIEMKHIAKQFAFVQSLPADNPHLPQSYWDELNSLPEQLRKAWVEGLWDAFVGQAFMEWRDAVHVKKVEPPDGWMCTAGMNWGYSTPGWFGLCYWGAEWRHHWRWEFYFGEGTEAGAMIPFDVGFKIGIELQRFEAPAFIVLDNAAFADSYQGLPRVSDASEIQRGINAAWGNNVLKAPQVLPSPPKTQNSRATRKTLMHAALKWTPGPDKTAPTVGMRPHMMPKGTFHPDCKQLIKMIPMLTVDPKDPTVIDRKHVGHSPFDGATYLYMAMHPMFADDYPDVVPEGRHPGIGVDAHGRARLLPKRPKEEDLAGVQSGWGVRWETPDRDEGSDTEGLVW